MRRTRRNRKSQMRTKRGGMWPFGNSSSDPAAVDPATIDPTTGKPKGFFSNFSNPFGSSTPAPQNAPLPSDVLTQPQTAIGGRRRRRRSRRRR